MIEQILRVVPRGAIATEHDAEHCDLDRPCDLVLLTVLPSVVPGLPALEQEVQRTAFDTGHAASKHLAKMFSHEGDAP